jgi:hypothetical protein
MSQATKTAWERKRTDETRRVEEVIRVEFPKTDAYRYNSASIRVRVIDLRFEGKSSEKRDAMVEPLIEKLPKSIQAQIINLLTLTPDEASNSSDSKSLLNLEFEHPSRSML